MGNDTERKTNSKRQCDFVGKGDDEVFLIEDAGDVWFINFYENNDGKRLVDAFYVNDPDDFDPEAFDFINGVPDNTEPENEFWA